MARLPFSADRLEGHDVNLRNDRLPVSFSHAIREIDDRMDDIVYNAIDTIQERARDNELRTFYYNLMSDRDYKNRDFEDLIGMIADIVDIGVTEGKFRDVRDAVIPVVEDVITLHIAYMTEDYPDLMDFVGRSQDRDIERAVRLFEKYRAAVDAYRRNGNRLPSGGRGGRDRDRDERYDDRDRGGRANVGSDRGDRGGRGGNSRRDRWERGAVRGGVHGSPQRSVQTRENRFGNTDQSDRFEDHSGSSNRNEREDRDEDRRDGASDRGSRMNDRYADSLPSTQTRRRDEEAPARPARIQRLPGSSRDSDITDALERENAAGSNQGNRMENNDIDVRSQLADTNNPTLQAFENLDAWVPSAKHPHPFVFNHTQDLFYEMDLTAGTVVPRVVNKGSIVNYYDHASMAFGNSPRDFSRFEDGGVGKRLNDLHTALINPSEDFNVEGSDQSVTYHNRVDFSEHQYLAYGLKEVMLRMNIRRFGIERQQPNGEKYHPVEIAVGKSSIIEPFITTDEEAGLLEELRSISTFTKMAEKLRLYSKKIRKELFLQLDRYLTTSVNRMLRQNLSIPALRVGSFTEDWLELFALITSQYGEAYRDAISTHQERELRNLMNTDTEAEIYVMTQLPESPTGIKPFVVAMPTKIMYINEVGFNLDIDMVPDVASQILPEANPFFHDLAQELLTKGADDYGRFFIQTSDLRVIEASRSFLNEKAVLLRVIK
jgi:hypothetical protein